jgi:osmotically inducible protein OsmC
MPVRTAEAEWKGNLTEGSGNLKVGSGAFEGPYSFASRFQDGEASTNPEELLGAAHAGCFTMATDAALTRAGYTPTRLHTTARVRLDKVGDAFSITKITLELEGEVPDLSREDFEKFAHEAKANCPLSKALTGTEIELIIK